MIAIFGEGTRSGAGESRAGRKIEGREADRRRLRLIHSESEKLGWSSGDGGSFGEHALGRYSSVKKTTGANFPRTPCKLYFLFIQLLLIFLFLFSYINMK